MVQKYTAPVRVYKYPFELVMAAYERRFPTCPLIPVFVGSDKIYENTSDDGAVHVIERRCVINVDAPYLLRKITGVDHVLFIQKNTLDRRKRVLKIEAWNESFSNRIHIHELCYYKANKDNDEWTIFEQQASLEVKSFWGFEHVVEKLAVNHYSQNVKKGEEIIEFHIKELADEGITFIPPFESSTSSSAFERVNCSTNTTTTIEYGATIESNEQHTTDGQTIATTCDKGTNGIILKGNEPQSNGCVHSKKEIASLKHHATAASLDGESCCNSNSQKVLNCNTRGVLVKSETLKSPKEKSNKSFKSFSFHSAS